jgi:undecaprenyl-diphosphatase
MLEHLNTGTVLFLNGLLRHHYVLTRIVQGLADNAIARGAPVFVPLLVLWFSSECAKRRGRMIAGLIGVAVATFASVALQRTLHLGVRPFLDPRLHLYLLNGEFADGWYHANSFPSDTAALFFALSTVVFVEWRLAGALAYGWSLLVNICRIALGFHSPIDVIAGIAWGAGVVYLFVHLRPLVLFAKHGLERSNARLPWIHALLVLFIADAYTLFLASRGILQVLHLLPGRH